MTATNILIRHGLREVPLRVANRAYASVRGSIGLRETPGTWLTKPTENSKFSHTVERFTYGLSLMPARSAAAYCVRYGFTAAARKLRGFGVCPHSTSACRGACLATAGKGCMSDVQAGRTARTLLWATDPDAAYSLTCHHIRQAVLRHGVENVAIRLNTLSDIEWERVLPAEFWSEFADVQFYDYTKSLERVTSRRIPANYHLTYSASERTTFDEVRDLVRRRINVAVVIGQHPDAPKPARWAGRRVVDGNATDARYLDPKGSVVLLGALGKARSLPVGERSFVKPARVA